MILYSEGATKFQECEAESILATLCSVYPGYPWSVRVYEGGFFIRHLGYPAGWGMNCKAPDFAYSSSAMKRQIILMAGEWLERAQLKRGRSNDDEPEHVEGIPEKDQLIEPVQFENIVVASDIRTEIRPQAAKELNG